MNAQFLKESSTTLFGLGNLQSIITPRLQYNYDQNTTSFGNVPSIDPSDRLFNTNTVTYSLNHYLNAVNGAAEMLDYLAALGVTAVEVMPVADFSGRRGWGYDGVFPYAPDASYGRPERLQGLRRGRARARHRRAARRRLQPLRTGRELSVRAMRPDFFTEPPQDAVGRRDQLRRSECAPGARLRHRERRILARRVPSRRAAARRGPRDQGRQPARHPRRTRRARPVAVRPSDPSPAREREQRARPARRDAGRASALHGAVERRRPPRAPRRGDATSRPAITATTARRGSSAGRSRKDSPIRASARAIAARRAAARARACRRPPSSPSSRTTTRSATAPSANGSSALAPLAGRPGARRASISSCRRSRCCSWARSGARRSRSCSSAISKATSRRPSATDGARNSRGFRNSPIRRASRRFPIRSAEATFLASKLDWSRLDADRLAFYRAALAARREHVRPLLPRDRARRRGDRDRRAGRAGRLDGRRKSRLVLDANLADGRRPVPAGSEACRSGVAARRRSGELGPWSVRWSVGRAMIPPRATYRLQMQGGFGFARPRRVAPYLARLGISHVYLSPVFKARPGSTHGYDITDHAKLNPELGTEADYAAMIEAFRREGLGVILDIVPNHMGVGGADNPLWLDVLEWGPGVALRGLVRHRLVGASRTNGGKLLAPVLGEQYGEALRARQARAQVRQPTAGPSPSGPTTTHKLPICPLTYPTILGREREALERIGDRFLDLPNWRPQIAERALEPQGRARRARARRRGAPRRRSRRGSRLQRRLARTRPADRRAVLARGVLPRRGGRNQLPALLQHQRSRRPADGARAGVRARARARLRHAATTARSRA